MIKKKRSAKLTQEAAEKLRIKRVKEGLGKYAGLFSTPEERAKEKQAEIARENRNVND